MKEVPPLPGEEALYGWIASVWDAAAKNPETKKALVESFVAADEELVKPLVPVPIQRPGGRQRLDRAGERLGVGNGLPEPHRHQQVEHVPEHVGGDAIQPARARRARANRSTETTQYTVTFPKGQVPPVKGFWSLTLYNDLKFFHPNPLNRFSLGTKNKTLKYAADGSLTLYLGAKSPGQENEANWLPAPAGPFSLILRLYWPEASVLEGQVAAAGDQEDELIRSAPSQSLVKTMKTEDCISHSRLASPLYCGVPASTPPSIPPQITTPDKVETSIGTLEYKDGAPSKETVAKAYDYLDLMHGVEAFVNAYQGASVASIFKGFEDAGVPNNTALIWSELMDAKSVFLTANADTIYFWVNLDVTKGPMVFETPPMSLGVIDDIWFRWVTDFGLPGPDRGEGGRIPVRAARLQGRTAGRAATSSCKLRTTRATALGPVVPREERPQARRWR